MHNDEALHIVRALADGVDPRTGEPLPADGPCDDVRVVRALHVAIRHLESALGHRRGLPPPAASGANQPARAGHPWDAAEDRRLASAFKKGQRVRQLAQAHVRTEGAIRARLKHLGLL
ncbi:MAG: hypothetical protein ACE37H_07800 [Phycisphaeraceae bacterium]